MTKGFLQNFDKNFKTQPLNEKGLLNSNSAWDIDLSLLLHIHPPTAHCQPMPETGSKALVRDPKELVDGVINLKFSGQQFGFFGVGAGGGSSLIWSLVKGFAR